ncbi:hypothetical protein CK203_011063 [Vitis vinifera]|uniref:Uncharacterized protein n=1 Tax=Vitis vinifera TaxID=29760 RepID=A0A438JIB4_VITVI|nr:hypothetical protein CK203_011063 [Vitis vinifera]
MDSMQAYPTYRIATKECGGGKPPPKLILVSHASPITAAFRHLSPPLPIYSSHPTTALSKPPLSPMADSPPTYEVEIQSQYHERGGLSISQILALITLLPTGGTLLLFAGLTFAASMVGLAVATPAVPDIQSSSRPGGCRRRACCERLYHVPDLGSDGSVGVVVCMGLPSTSIGVLAVEGCSGSDGKGPCPKRRPR